MNVNATSNPYGQMQMGQMFGNGQGGMNDIVQNLSSEDKASLREKMQSLPREERLAMKDEMREIDASNLSSEEYFQSLLDLFTQVDPNEESTGFSVYA